VTLEKKFCPCGCGLHYRGLPGKPSQYFSRNHDPNQSGSPAANGPVVRRRGRPRKNRATYTPENSADPSVEAVEDAGDDDERAVLRELAVG